MIKKKLCIIGSAGIPANYGGFETLVNYISENISKEYKFYATILYYCLKQDPNKRINSQQLINLLNKYK